MKKRKVRELKYGYQPEDTGQPPPTRPPRRFGEETIPLHREHMDEFKREERLQRLEHRMAALEAKVWDSPQPEPSTPQADAQPREDPGDPNVKAFHIGRIEREREAAKREGLILPNPQREAANLQALSLWTRPECWRVEGTAEERVRTRAMIDHLNSLVQIAINGGEVPRP